MRREFHQLFGTQPLPRIQTTRPMSRLLTFTHGSKNVLVQCDLHTSQHAKQGWYKPAERTVQISEPFQLP